MEDFALRYGETWQTWDAAGFLALFHEEIVYIAHPEEIVRGIDELARYFRKEQETQGGAVRVRMGGPIVQGSRVIAEILDDVGWPGSAVDLPWLPDRRPRSRRRPLPALPGVLVRAGRRP